MTYEEAKVYLEDLSKYGSVLGLESIQNLLIELKSPEQGLPAIHIAGTNGKGSTLAYLSAVLEEAGYRVGRYHSPAVFHPRESIQINHSMISEAAFAEALSKVKKGCDSLIERGAPHPTRFEVETALAFCYFKTEACDMVLLETGLGGRNDATNVIPAPILTLFSSIGMDHMTFIGDTLETIAREKAGILKKGSHVVSAIQEPDAEMVLKDSSSDLNIPYTQLLKSNISNICYGLEQQSFQYKQLADLTLSIAGNIQIENAALAVEAALQLKELGWKLNETHIRNGLKNARWQGRMTGIHKNPLIIIDGAHNEAAAYALKETLLTVCQGKKLIFVVGIFKDKEYQKIIRLLAPIASQIYTIPLPDTQRGLSPVILADEAKKYQANCYALSSVKEAAAKCLRNAEECDVIVAFGSLSYLDSFAKEIRKESRKESREV